MSTRSLWPWLLAGALFASAYANLSMYRSLNASKREQAPAAIQDPGSVPSFHLAPDSSGERCPTLDRLGLTEEQRNQIRKCSLTSLDLRTDLAIEINRATTEIQELLSKEAVEGGRILELSDHVSSLRSRQYRAWIGSILVVRDVLTPEQLKLLHNIEFK